MVVRNASAGSGERAAGQSKHLPGMMTQSGTCQSNCWQISMAAVFWPSSLKLYSTKYAKSAPQPCQLLLGSHTVNQKCAQVHRLQKATFPLLLRYKPAL